MLASGLRGLLLVVVVATLAHSTPAKESLSTTKKPSPLLSSLLPKTTNTPITTTKKLDENDAINFLQRVGYLPKETQGGPQAMHDLNDALRQLQRFTGLKETGELDEATIKVMKSPRCGLPDTIKPSSLLAKRFSAIGRWSRRDLTYSILNYPTRSYDLSSSAVVDREIETSFKDWSDVANLRFSKTPSRSSDIQVAFYRGSHGDGNSFDGSGNTLAHAFFPQDGRLHGDDDERWTTGYAAGPNLRQVMTHEVGHIIGLAHSSVREAVMYPYYTYRSDFKLASDDINGAVYLYGRSQDPATQPPVGNTGAPQPRTIFVPAPTTRSPPTTRSAPTTKRPRRGNWWYWFFNILNG